MIKINLLSEGKRPAAVRKAKSTALLQRQDIGLWMLAAGLLLGAAATGAYWWQVKGDVDAQQEEIAAANRDADQLAAVIQQVEDYKAKKPDPARTTGISNDVNVT